MPCLQHARAAADHSLKSTAVLSLRSKSMAENSGPVTPLDFTSGSYRDRVKSTAKEANEGRNRYIEWSFGTMGVLLAGAVAAAAQSPTLAMIASITVLLLGVPFLSPAVRYHSLTRRYGLIQHHLDLLDYGSRIGVAPPSTDHVTELVNEVDFGGAQVESRRSLCWNVLRIGPGYLFAGALASLLFLFLSTPNLGGFTIGSLSLSGEMVKTAVSVGVILTFAIQLRWMFKNDLNGRFSEVVARSRDCKACITQGDAEMLRRLSTPAMRRIE